MQIISIHLKNIKSHRDSEISFAPGINVLSGPNGVGKSTIFEAIGYAMFGVDARDFVSNIDRFLTIGTKRGEVSVTFALDGGDTYRVTRTVGTPANWRLAKEQSGVFEIEDHANAGETEARIRHLLGLSPARALADQFKLVIGPFQHDFLGPFVLKQQTKRKEAFDEILGIDSWRKTFDGTKELGSVIKGMIAAGEAEVAAKKERVAALPERQGELAAIAAEEESKKRELLEKNLLLTATAELLSMMEGKKAAIETVRQEIVRIEQNILSGTEHISTQQALVEQAEDAVRIMEEVRPGKERFDTAEKMLALQREREKERQALERELARIAAEETSARQTAEHEEREADAEEKRLQEEIAALGVQEEELSLSAAALAEKENAAQAASDLQRRIHDRFEKLPLLSAMKVIPYLKTTLGRVVEIEQAIAGKLALLADEKEWQAKAGSLEALRKEREGIQGEKARLQGQRTGLVEGEEKLQEGLCPFFHEQCRNLEGMATLEVFSGKMLRLDEEIAVLDAAAAAVDERIASAEAAARMMERFRMVRNDLENLDRERRERESDRQDLMEKLAPETVRESLASWTSEFGLHRCRQEGEKLVGLSLAGTAVEQLAMLAQGELQCSEVIEAIRAILAAMQGDVDEAIAAVQAGKAGVTALSGELLKRKVEMAAAGNRIGDRRKAAAASREAALLAQLKKQEKAAALEATADVHEAICHLEEVKATTRHDHERFLQAEPVAREVTGRRETLAKYLARLKDLETGKKTRQEKVLELEAAYSPEAHAAAQSDRDAARIAAAALGERLKSLAENRARIAREIVELEKVEEEIREKEKEVGVLRKKEDLVKFLRTRIFKNVSAQLSERFREEISLRADSIYRTIAESDEELSWGDNYQVVLRDVVDGTIRERSDDQLSGGQVMSAVVSLRLALLQTIGARVAFFDEPTSNLDASRRENLARAFRAIDHGEEEVTTHWYDQLFLISHDLSFTEITDQIIDLSH